MCLVMATMSNQDRGIINYGKERERERERERKREVRDDSDEEEG